MLGYQMYIPRKAETCAVYEEFNHLADMIWKFPRYLENEEHIEREKLDDYFPEENPQLASSGQFGGIWKGKSSLRHFPAT